MRLRTPFGLRLSILGLCALLCFSFGFNQTPAHAATPACIQYGAFTKSVNYIVAQHEGFFAQEGLNICYNQVVGSVQQFNTLFAGGYDIISTASDNVANRVVNQQAAVEMIDSQDGGSGLTLGLNGNNGIHSISDLRGKPIAVDAPDSGFVFALRKILAANGLYLENGDYSLQIVGGGFQRYAALTQGHTPSGDLVYGTMLNNPLDVLALQTPGITIAARFQDFVAPYEGAGLAVTNAYAAAHASTLTSVIRAFIRAGQFATNPANRATVDADVAAELHFSPAIAHAAVTDAQDPVSGEKADAQMSRKGLINTLNLRQEFGGFSVPVDTKKLAKSGGGVYDDQFWKAAMHSLGDDNGDD